MLLTRQVLVKSLTVVAAVLNYGFLGFDRFEKLATGTQDGYTSRKVWLISIFQMLRVLTLKFHASLPSFMMWRTVLQIAGAAG